MSITYYSYLNVKIDFSMKTDGKQRPFVATFKFNKRRSLKMQSKRINIKKLTVKRSLKTNVFDTTNWSIQDFPETLHTWREICSLHGLNSWHVKCCLRYTWKLVRETGSPFAEEGLFPNLWSQFCTRVSGILFLTLDRLKTNRLPVVLRLFSDRSQTTSKCVTHSTHLT